MKCHCADTRLRATPANRSPTPSFSSKAATATEVSPLADAMSRKDTFNMCLPSSLAEGVCAPTVLQGTTKTDYTLSKDLVT